MRVEVMRMKRKTTTQKTTTQQTEWPRTLYLTPDRWSAHAEVYVVDERELRRMVSELRALGDDWRKVSMSDATPIYLVAVRDNSTAIYGHGRGTALYLVRRMGPGWYEWESYEEVLG
jgi:hypothetical protein